MGKAFRFAALAIALAIPGLAAAQAWPSKPVHIIVGFAPGGPTDTIARLVADGMGKSIGQPVIVENKPGAGSNLAAELVAKAPPDGHTLMVAGTGPLTVNDALYSTLQFKPDRDFTIIALTAQTPLVLAVTPDLPVHSVKDLIAYAKEKRGQVNFGSPGVGVSPHFAAEMFRATAGFDSVHVPYRGGAPMIAALMKGEVQWGFDAPLTISPQHKGGKLRAIAVASDKRWPMFPDVPTLVELGYKDLTIFAWFALAGPAGLPGPIVDRLNKETERALATPEARERLANIGFEATPVPPADAAKLVAAERARWLKVAKDHNIKVE